jgi:CRP-like cAMP-binding protein
LRRARNRSVRTANDLKYVLSLIAEFDAVCDNPAATATATATATAAAAATAAATATAAMRACMPRGNGGLMGEERTSGPLDVRSPCPWPADDLLGCAITFKKGAVIARAGSEVRTLYLIDRGVVGRFVPTGGREVLVGVRTAGWLLGAVPAITNGRYQATTTALTECVLRPLPIAAFRQAIRALDLGVWLNEMLALDVHAHMRRAAAIGSRRLQALIEELLVELLVAAGRTMSDGSIRLTLQVSVTNVATLVDASRERTSRVLADLDAIGTLTRVGGWLTAPVKSSLIDRIDSSRLH